MSIRAALTALAVVLATPSLAQIITVPLDPVDPGEVVTLPPADPQGAFVEPEPTEPPPPGSVVGEDVTTVTEDVVAGGTGARLRGLDKLAGAAEDLVLKVGETGALGWLQVTLGDCRYPEDNPSGDAYAWLVVRDPKIEAPLFQGWMVASSPALNALDHARYDVWVIRCTTD